jgi:hypothetical protein
VSQQGAHLQVSTSQVKKIMVTTRNGSYGEDAATTAAATTTTDVTTADLLGACPSDPMTPQNSDAALLQ